MSGPRFRRHASERLVIGEIDGLLLGHVALPFVSEATAKWLTDARGRRSSRRQQAGNSRLPLYESVRVPTSMFHECSPLVKARPACPRPPGTDAGSPVWGAVLPVYVVEPELWATGRCFGQAVGVCGRRRLAGSAGGVWQVIGAPLVVRVGDAVEVLARVCVGGTGSRGSSVMKRPVTLWTYARDRRVAGLGAGQRGWSGPRCHRAESCAACRRGTSGQLSSRRIHVRLLPFPFPSLSRRSAGVEPGLIPNSARALKLARQTLAPTASLEAASGGRSW